MKQKEDTRTVDMFADLAPTSADRYRFYVTKDDGNTVEWTGLTKTMARNMYAYTNKHQPCDVIAFGWEEMK